MSLKYRWQNYCVLKILVTIMNITIFTKYICTFLVITFLYSNFKTQKYDIYNLIMKVLQCYLLCYDSINIKNIIFIYNIMNLLYIIYR